jgi:cytochrome c oxidase subunit 2
MSACGGMQSALDPAGPDAARVASSWWLSLALAGTVLILVTAAVLYAVLRRRPSDWSPSPAFNRSAQRWIIVALAASLLILIVQLVGSTLATRELPSSLTTRALHIAVTGHQWWWEVVYEPDDPGRRFSTANEIHIPVGQPVLISLHSGDVIHSFWVPSLAGKKDAIPGYDRRINIRATKAGVYRGTCAEFCGTEHARMSMYVVAESPRDFSAWYQRQHSRAAAPADSMALEGEQVFRQHACALCHSVRGTDARGNVAPDLTHLASRFTIAAGTFPNTPGHLAGWILNPRTLKPGTKMPATALEPLELRSLLAYLSGLK